MATLQEQLKKLVSATDKAANPQEQKDGEKKTANKLDA